MRNLCCWFLLMIGLMVQPAIAATFVVNSLSDDNAADNNPGDGICEDVRGGTRCTLRAAIDEANSGSTLDVINFNVGSFFVINLESALPAVTANVYIDGRTEAGYNSAATDISQAPPRVYLNGSGLSGTPAADGLRVVNAYARVDAIGFLNFPDNGIEVSGDGIDINNCWIGIAANGTIGANGRGIYLSQADGGRVGQYVSGTNLVGLGNVISANAGDGIYLINTEDSMIAGNRIGTSPDGNSNRANGGDGIELLGANNTLGTGVAVSPGVFRRAGNRIAYNAGYGVNAAVGGQKIYGNAILSNGLAGVRLAGTGSNVGFVNPDLQRNQIHGNSGAGILVSGSSHLVQQNLIYQNAAQGVDASSGSGHDIRQNFIYGNGLDGLRIAASTSEASGNDIGRNADGVPVPNLGNGVLLEASGNTVYANRIGGAPGSQGDGIEVRSGSGNAISLNRIGAVETLNIGNDGFGIRVAPTALNTLIDDNVIGFNGGGIALLGSGAQVCGNKVGFGDNGAVIGNIGAGIYVENAFNTVGAEPLGCDGNQIVNNGSTGIILRGSGHVVADNSIGWCGGGNGNGGVKIDTGAADNLVLRNSIAHNTSDGIRVVAAAGDRNRFDENTFYNNSGMGIDLGDNGTTLNDGADADNGANRLQNFPQWLGTPFSPGPGQIRVEYWVNSVTPNSAFPIKVLFHRAGLGERQGYTLLHTEIYTTQGVNRFATITLPSGTSTGTLIAIAIDNDGNTSEFSDPLVFAVVPLTDDVFKNGFE